MNLFKRLKDDLILKILEQPADIELNSKITAELSELLQYQQITNDQTTAYREQKESFERLIFKKLTELNVNLYQMNSFGQVDELYILMKFYYQQYKRKIDGDIKAGRSEIDKFISSFDFKQSKTLNQLYSYCVVQLHRQIHVSSFSKFLSKKTVFDENLSDFNCIIQIMQNEKGMLQKKIIIYFYILQQFMTSELEQVANVIPPQLLLSVYVNQHVLSDNSKNNRAGADKTLNDAHSAQIIDLQQFIKQCSKFIINQKQFLSQLQQCTFAGLNNLLNTNIDIFTMKLFITQIEEIHIVRTDVVNMELLSQMKNVKLIKIDQGQQLQQLKLENFVQLENLVLENLSIEQLILENCPKLECPDLHASKILQILATNCTELQHFTLNPDQIIDTLSIQKCSKFLNINFPNCTINKIIIEESDQLKKVDLRKTIIGNIELFSCPNLSSIEFPDKMESILINNCGIDYFCPSSLKVNNMSLHNCPRLGKTDFSNCQINNVLSVLMCESCLSVVFSRDGQTEKIIVQQLPITNINFEKQKVNVISIQECQKLQKLDLINSQFKKLQLYECNQLDLIVFPVNRIEIDSIQIKHCENILTFSIVNHHLKELNIEQCQNINIIDVSTSNADTIKLTECAGVSNFLFPTQGSVKDVLLNKCLLPQLNIKNINIDKLSLQNCGTVQINAQNVKIQKYDIIQCSKLQQLKLSDINITAIQISQCEKLLLELQYCNIDDVIITKQNTKLDFSQCTIQRLKAFGCSNILLPTSGKMDFIELVQCDNIQQFDLHEITINEVTLKECQKLVTVNCAAGKIVNKLRLENLKQLNNVQLQNNQFTLLELIKLPILANFSTSCVLLTQLNVEDCSLIQQLDLSLMQELNLLKLRNCGKLSQLLMPHKVQVTELQLHSLYSLKECQFGEIRVKMLQIIETNLKQIDISCSCINKIQIEYCDQINSVLLNPLHFIDDFSVISCNALQFIGFNDVNAARINIVCCPQLLNCKLNKCNDLKDLNIQLCEQLGDIAFPDDSSILKINISDCILLQKLEFNKCQIQHLTIRKCQGLALIDLFSGQSECITVAGCKQLKELLIPVNNTKNLVVQNCQKLQQLDTTCQELEFLQLECVDVLEQFLVKSIFIKQIILTCSKCAFSLPQNANLDLLKLSGCMMKQLKLKNLSVEKLIIIDGDFKNIDLSEVQSQALYIQKCQNLQQINLPLSGTLKQLVIAQCDGIKQLELNSLEIEYLQVNKNEQIAQIDVDMQKITQYRIYDNKKFKDIQNCELESQEIDE